MTWQTRANRRVSGLRAKRARAGGVIVRASKEAQAQKNGGVDVGVSLPSVAVQAVCGTCMRSARSKGRAGGLCLDHPGCGLSAQVGSVLVKYSSSFCCLPHAVGSLSINRFVHKKLSRDVANLLLDDLLVGKNSSQCLCASMHPPVIDIHVTCSVYNSYVWSKFGICTIIFRHLNGKRFEVLVVHILERACRCELFYNIFCIQKLWSMRSNHIFYF